MLSCCGCCAVLILPVCLSLTYYWLFHVSRAAVCYPDVFNNSAPVCRPGCVEKYFSVPGMTECQPWLTCEDIESGDFQVIQMLGHGAVKLVQLVKWRGLQMALNTPHNLIYLQDFRDGLTMLTTLQGSPHITQLLGSCRDSFLTEYHKLGSAESLSDVLSRHTPDSLAVRLKLCASYAEVLSFLHASPAGTRVMCDSNDLHKTLNQYLVRGDLKLLANDLDALPEVDVKAGRFVKCGHRPLYGDFVAPEQRWPYDAEFNDTEMSAYDEKTDIWKMPDVCDYFLGRVKGGDVVRFRLFRIHKQCKAIVPSERPSAPAVLQEYKDALNQL